MDTLLVDTAKVMAKGQITLPKDIRDALGVRAGDRVTLIRKDDQVIMMNSAVYAMKMLQTATAGEAPPPAREAQAKFTFAVNAERSVSKSKCSRAISK